MQSMWLRALPAKEQEQKTNTKGNKMLFGLYTMCEFNGEAPEPEGTVLYNELPPKIGTEVVLSDKKVWIVTEFQEYNSTVYVKLKQEREQK